MTDELRDTVGKQGVMIGRLRMELLRLHNRAKRRDILYDALHGNGARSLQNMLDEHAGIIYEALRTRPNPLAERHSTLVQLCDAKRSYEVPPEYSGVLNVEGRILWSPTDTEMARVLVSATVADPHGYVFYADLVKRLDSIVSLARPHIYRSLRVILRTSPERGGTVDGIKLR